MKSYRIAQTTRHYENLAKLAKTTNPKIVQPNNFELGQSLYRRLRRAEAYGHRAAENYCNVPNFDWDKAHEEIEFKVKHIFGGVLPGGFFVNGDPRGYCLKIDTDSPMPEGMYKDWGGYGILAPEF